MRGLYGITDSVLLDGKLEAYVEAALKGGARLIQYRDKSQDQAKRLAEAQALAELCQKHKATLIINDDLALAAELSVSLHLGQGDGSLVEARKVLGERAIIGATCHASLELAAKASSEGASYLAFGRFFNSHTKPGAPAANSALLQEAKNQFHLPLVAIGGVTLANAPTLIAQGADLIAVVHALFSAESALEVEDRAHAFSQLFMP